MQNANMRTNWFLLGDIHGQAAPIEYFYKFNNERLNLDTFQNNLILLGDVGCNFPSSVRVMSIVSRVFPGSHLPIYVFEVITRQG